MDEAGDEQLTDTDSDWVQWAEHEAKDMDDVALFILEKQPVLNSTLQCLHVFIV